MLLGEQEGLKITFECMDQGPYISRQGRFKGTLANFEGQEYHCRSISVFVTVGDDESSLYYNDDKFVITSESPSWNSVLAEEMESQEEACRTIVVADAGAVPLDESVVFTICGNVNMVEGETKVSVVYEYCVDSEYIWLKKRKEFKFVKKNASLYLKNLVTTKQGSPAVFCTEFGLGDGILFSWESNGTNFKIYKKNDSTPIYNGKETKFSYSSGIQNDTTFLLQATQSKNSMIASDGEIKMDSPEDFPNFQLGEQLLFETITLTASKPVINAEKLTVSSKSELNSLTVSSKSELNSLTVEKDLNAKNAAVCMISSKSMLELENLENGDRKRCKVEVGTDGFIMCQGNAFNANEFYVRIMLKLTITVFRKNEEYLKMEDSAFYVLYDSRSYRESLVKKKHANLLAPVAAGDVVEIECTMHYPDSDPEPRNEVNDMDYLFHVECFFLPFGKGDVTYR